MIKFEIYNGQSWEAVDGGIFLSDSRLLAWHRTVQTRAGSIVFRGVAKWRLSEETINNPVFKAICFKSLSAEQQTEALQRKNTTNADRDKIATVRGSLFTNPYYRNSGCMV